MCAKTKSGFSLMEVNIAIFVMATGVIAMAGLFPLGMRESILSQTDFKQAMFADYVLNIAVTAASSTNVTWEEWAQWAGDWNTVDASLDGPMSQNMHNAVPDFIWGTGQSGKGGQLGRAITEYGNNQMPGFQHKEATRNKTYAVYCVLVPGFSDQVMGIMVRSLEMDVQKSNMGNEEKLRRLQIQPAYYAEARFHGKP